MLIKFSICLVLSFCLVYTSAQTPAMKISRSFSDSAGYFRSLLTGALGNVTLSNMGFTSYQTRDGIRTVTMNLTNIQVLNSTINASSQSTNVLISTPN